VDAKVSKGLHEGGNYYISKTAPSSPRDTVCLSVCPSQVGVLLKWLNVGSHKQHHTIVEGLQFSEAKDLREIRPGSPATGAPNAGGVGQNRRLSTNNRLYLENGTRQTHGFYQSRIGSRVRSIEW